VGGVTKGGRRRPVRSEFRHVEGLGPTYALSSVSWLREQWQRTPDIVDELLLDGDPGEASIVWREIGGVAQPVAELRALDDQWEYLAWLARELASLGGNAEDRFVTPAQVIAHLEQHGYAPSHSHGRIDRWQ